MSLERPQLPPVRGSDGNPRGPFCSVKAPRVTMVRFPVRRLDSAGDVGGEHVLGPGEFRLGGRGDPLVDAAGGSSRVRRLIVRSVGVRSGVEIYARLWGQGTSAASIRSLSSSLGQPRSAVLASGPAHRATIAWFHDLGIVCAMVFGGHRSWGDGPAVHPQRREAFLTMQSISLA